MSGSATVRERGAGASSARWRDARLGARVPGRGLASGPLRDDELSAVSGTVHSWDISTGVDGPGSRFTLFTAGCPLSCLYCHNPDTQTMRSGERHTVGEVMTELTNFERFLKVARGGVTVSGGEPLLQPRFTEAVLRSASARGLHTALDTSGYLGDRASDALLDATDLVLLDVKSWNPDTYRRVTNVDLDPTLRFARRLAERGDTVWVRFVLVPGLTDDEVNVAGLARFVASLGNVERVDVLPFHRLGAEKYEQLGRRYVCADVEPPSGELLDRVRHQFAARGLAVC